MLEKDTVSIVFLQKQPIVDYGTTAIATSLGGLWRSYNISQLPLEAQKRQKYIGEQLSTMEFTRESTYNGTLFSNGEINAMIQQLAEDYYQYHMQQPKEAQPKRPITINPFQNGNAFTVSCQTAQAVVFSIQDAASGKKRWKDQKGGGPQFHHMNKDKTSKTVIEYNTTDRTAPLNNTIAKSLWDQLDQFNDRDVDAVLIALAYCAASKEPSVWIFASDILDHRGIAPITKKDTPEGKERRAGHRIEDMAPYAGSFSRIGNIWVTIQQYINDEGLDQKTKRRKKKMYTHSGRFLSIDETWHQREFNHETGEYEQGVAIGWKIRPGDWLRTFLEFPNEQIALLCQTTLGYDPHNEMWPKRLAYYLFFHGHISNQKGGGATLNRTVEDLLTVNSLDIDERFPQRTRDRFEKAMNRLVTDKIIDAWEYKEAFELPSRRWLKVWLEQMVSIHIAPKKALS